jgi:hypothetical protein
MITVIRAAGPGLSVISRSGRIRPNGSDSTAGETVARSISPRSRWLSTAPRKIVGHPRLYLTRMDHDQQKVKICGWAERYKPGHNPPR